MTTKLTDPAAAAVAPQTAVYGPCGYCPKTYTLLVIAGRFCDSQCEYNHRASETTWRRAVAA